MDQQWNIKVSCFCHFFHGQTKSGGELYIRWCEVTAFMPSMQFSIAPWSFNDDEIMVITKFYIDLHAEFVFPLMQNLIKNNGEIINKPIWWLNPRDDNTYSIDDQFTIGTDYLKGLDNIFKPQDHR